MKRPIRMLAALLLACTLPAVAQTSAWQTISNPGPVVGADGRTHTASCSGFPGTDPTFRFYVRPGDPKKLAVIFDGGGACWDNLTCSHPFTDAQPAPLLQFYTAAIDPDADPTRYGGLLDTANPANPIAGWTWVAIPYCTADVHLGSADRSYRMPGPRGESFTIRHRGYDNFMVVLDWIRRNVQPGVTDLMVTGASAGGYGAAASFPWVAAQYPQARLSVLADASQGVATLDFDLRGRLAWNPQLAPWVFGADPSAVRSADLLKVGAQAYPQGRFAQYTTTLDSVQVGFYGYMRVANGPGGVCRQILPDWNNQMLQTLDGYRAALPNFRSYVAAGTSHTIIGDGALYEPSGAGPSMASWVTAMLDFSAGPGAWVDAACPTCLRPLPCR